MSTLECVPPSRLPPDSGERTTYGAVMAMELGARLRELRGSRTQAEAAAALGVSSASLSAWENGNAIPPEHRLRSLAAYYGNGRTSALLRELQQLHPGQVPRPAPMSELMRDIRDLLQEIRDRLPPVPQSE